MTIDPITGRAHLRRALGEAATTLGLGDEPTIEWVYNPGNFFNANYRVTDGATDLHVKLVVDTTGPDRWFRLRDRLARDYRAPEVLARLDLAEAGLTGYVFPRLPGWAPDPARAAPLIREAGAVLGRLHADEGLARELAYTGPVTLLESFETGILECLTEDLISVRAHPEVSRWLDPDAERWLVAEAAALAEEGRRRIPDEPALGPIHGDPWIANLLVHDDGWHLLDWDDLRLGDPAGDWSMLLFDAWAAGADPEELLPAEPALRDRVRVHLRAASFDGIVDPLADVTEMPPDVPDADAIRAEKRRHSDAALRRYRRIYG